MKTAKCGAFCKTCETTNRVVEQVQSLPAGKEVIWLAHIIVDDNEMLEKAIKRFKRMVEKEGIIREYKKREYYEKPSTILNRKKKAIQRKLLKKSRKGKADY
jgi:small subunit ribosomal protein S21